MTEYTKEMLESLRWYTGSDYDELNDAVRSGRELTPKVQRHWDNIKAAFFITRPLTEPLVVYRGKKSDTLRQVVTPLSTSIYMAGTQDFIGQKCCLLHITVSPGVKVINVSELSHNPVEKEMLLEPGGNLILTSVETQPIKLPMGTREMKTLYMTYVPRVTVTIDLASPDIEGATSDNIVQRYNLERVIALIPEDEYEFIDSVESAVEAIKSLNIEVNGISEIARELYEFVSARP